MKNLSHSRLSRFSWMLPVVVLGGIGIWALSIDARKAASVAAEKEAVVDESVPQENAGIPLSESFALEDLGRRAIPLAETSSPSGIPQREWMHSAWQSDPDPAVKAFSEWAVKFSSLSGEASIGDVENGVRLATERKIRMAEIIREDPRRALAAAVPSDIIAGLPHEVASHLEQVVHGFGDLVTEYQCGDKPSQRLLATVGGKTYDARIYGSRRNLNYYLGSSLHGIILDDQMAVLDGPVVVQRSKATNGPAKFLVGDQEHELKEGESIEKIESALAMIEGTDVKLKNVLESKGLSATYSDFIYAMGDSGLSASSGYPKRRAESHTHGGKKILILRLRASDDSWPANQTEQVFNNWSYATDGWDNRLRLTSYGKTWLEAVDVTPVLTLSSPASYYVYQSNGSTVYNSDRWANDGEAAARAAGYNPDNYFCVVVATREFANGGIGWAAGKRIWVNGAFSNFAALMHHEFGHTLGLPHASAWSSTDGNPISPNRVNQEYGDENDPMGNGGKTYRNTYQAYFKNLSGWMPDTSVQTITESGTYTLYQDDGNTSFDRPLALKIARDHEIMYWVSVRGDLLRYADGSVIRTQAEFMNGASIVAVTPWENPHTLDLNNPASNRMDSPLALGQIFNDTAADLTFRVVEVGGTNPNRFIKLQVTFGHLHRGGYRPLVSGGVYRFKNRHNNRYLTVPNNSSNNSVNLQMGDLNTTNLSQSFVAWRNENGSYSFNHQGTDKWMDVQSNSGNNGARIRQYTRSTTGDDAQNWNIFQTETDSLFILHQGTEGRLMEMDVNNQRVHQMNTTGTAWQQWIPEMIGISPGTYRVLPRLAETQGLEVGNAAIGDGPNVIRSKYIGYNNQQWKVEDLTDGRIRLAPGHAPTKALDVSNSSTSDGSRIQQWDWNQSAAQRWQFTRVDGHWLRFTPDCAPNSCMDARGATSASTVQLWTYNGANSQQWRFADPDPNIVETPFKQWTRRLQLSGNESLSGWDQDGDGVINLMEFALNGDPASAGSRGGYHLVDSSSGPTLMTAVRSGATFNPSGTGSLVAIVDGLRYEVQASSDLVDWSLPVEALVSLPANEAPGLSEGWEYRAFTAGSDPGGNAFLRVQVSETL